MIPAEPVVTLLVCFFISHARLRVRLAPGVSCALCFQREGFFAKPRALNALREGEGVSEINDRHSGAPRKGEPGIHGAA